jgi:hypothetical protein
MVSENPPLHYSSTPIKGFGGFEMTQSDFAAAIDKIVTDYNMNLAWVSFSKDRLTQEAARVLVQQWASFTREEPENSLHARQAPPVPSAGR